MSAITPQATTPVDTRPRWEVADVLRLYGDAYRQHYPVSAEQRLVMRDIVQCRTAVLGGHVDACDTCGGLRISYNSCRNRHCPQCGSVAKAEWLERQKAHLLPTHYFHVVFTIDHAFNPLARVNPQAIYDLLFHSAAETLKQFGQRYLGGEIGLTATLHTWGQTLSEHIHLHCVVTGGVLTRDGRRWQATTPDYLFPVVELSASFRDTFCQGMLPLYQTGGLHFVGQSAPLAEPSNFAQLLQEAREKKWQVYVKPPFGDAAQVLDYLGRYTQRIAISNHRLLEVANGQVRFSYRDYQADGQHKEMTLPAVEFIRRFLQHVLPRQFVRIRHYGLLAPCCRERQLARCRALLGHYAAGVSPPTTRAERVAQLLTHLLGHAPDRCPHCGSGHFVPYQELPPHPSRRRWVLAVH